MVFTQFCLFVKFNGNKILGQMVHLEFIIIEGNNLLSQMILSQVIEGLVSSSGPLEQLWTFDNF